MPILSRTIWILALVSLFTDLASEMLYPVMPVYLKSIGFSVLLIGMLEGIAEAAAGLSKGYFGDLSDRTGRRLPFIRAGYALSAVAKPLLAFFTNAWWVFLMRTAERFGKGLRTAARDAMLSDEATHETKGRVFGFHRTMDTLGAFLGPGAALLFLHFCPQQYKTLFLVAFIPGVAAIALTFLLREKSNRRHHSERGHLPGNLSFISFVRFWSRSPAAYKKLTAGLLAFALFNSSDVFLLLKVKEAGMNDTCVIGAYIFYNLVYAAAAYPLGHLGDRIGLRTVFITGLFLFAAVYGGMAFSSSLPVFFALFFIYGIYAAATEGIAKAWITNIVSHDQTATAIGTYTAFQSICTMVASTLAGMIWHTLGAPVTFVLSATAAAAVGFYFLTEGARRTPNPAKN
ncbi:MAG TPA: MFS transporter [Chitinophagales bacterium]|nr:MFS transporter [Chitinophagales bacterium]